MFFKSCTALAAVTFLVGATVWAADSSGPNLEGVKCVVATRQASANKSADHKDGKVYFCCGGCAAKFKATPDKFETKANMQLVATKQYKQQKCPLTGGKLNPATTLKVGSAEVQFCCNGCKGKVTAAKQETQLDMVFGDKAFQKGDFTLVEADKE